MNGYLIWGRDSEKEGLFDWIGRGCDAFEEKSGEKPDHLLINGLPPQPYPHPYVSMEWEVLDIVPDNTVYIGVKDGRINQTPRLGP